MITRGGNRGTLMPIAAVLAVLVAALPTGCGSSGSSSSADSTASSGGSTAEFIKKGSKNPILRFGTEADDAEREAASEVLEENLKARAAGNWTAQCSSLDASARKVVEESPTISEGNSKGCAKDLETQGEPESETKEARINTMTGPIAVLRIKGSKAFALYHGTKGKNYAMPMSKEDGVWKVGSLVTQELP